MSDKPIGWTTAGNLKVLKENPGEAITIWGLPSPEYGRTEPLYAGVRVGWFWRWRPTDPRFNGEITGWEFAGVRPSLDGRGTLPGFEETEAIAAAPAPSASEGG